MAEKQNAIQVVKAQDLGLTQFDPAELRTIVQDNVGAGGITEFDLDRVRVPAGGVTTWTIPTLEGEQETKELTGVIVYWREPRAYWAASFDETGGGTPPDCYSPDGVHGYGNPGGLCARCPFAQFGSAERGRGQACKQMRLLFMLRPGAMLPLVVVAPPTSIKPLKQYFLRLAANGKPYWSVVTKLLLEKTKNQDGIAYSRIVPQLAAVLDAEAAEKMRQYAEAIRPALEAVQITQEDVGGEEA